MERRIWCSKSRLYGHMVVEFIVCQQLHERPCKNGENVLNNYLYLVVVLTIYIIFIFGLIYFLPAYSRNSNIYLRVFLYSALGGLGIWQMTCSSTL